MLLGEGGKAKNHTAIFSISVAMNVTFVKSGNLKKNFMGLFVYNDDKVK